MANSVPKTHSDKSRAVPVSRVEPYCPPISAIANDPAKLIERQLEAELREMEALMSAQPGIPVPGTGPEVSIGIDAEWVHDPITRTNRRNTRQFRLVCDVGGFSPIQLFEAQKRGGAGFSPFELLEVTKGYPS